MSDVTPPPPPPPPPSSAPGAPTYNYAPSNASRFSILAIVGFILAFVFAPAGLVVSIIARVQIKKTGDRGGSLALWGLILSIVFIVLWVGSIVLLFALAVANGGSYSYSVGG